MSASTRVIAQPTLRGRWAAAALAAMFGIGVLTGLAVPLVPRLAQGSTSAAAVAARSASDLAAYLAFRAGERGDTPAVSRVGDPTWLAYRAGERQIVPVVPAVAADSVGSQAWLVYRAGERGDPGR